MKLKEGLNPGISNKFYHGDLDWFSSSSYKMLLTNPAEFHRKHILKQVEPERKESDSLVEGSLSHTLVYESHLIAAEYAVFEGLRKAGAAYEEFVANVGSGKQIVSRAQMERCKAYQRAHNANPVAVSLTKDALHEHTVCVQFHGIPTKVRADAIQVEAGVLSDLKTSAFSVSEVADAKATIKKWDYDISAALYSAVFEQFYGKPFEWFWVLVSKSDLETQVYKMSQDTRDKAMKKVMKAISIYNECMRTGVWPETPPPKPKPTYDVKEI